ncbi:MAG: hypothetical protein BWY84_00842 [Candidatus Aerophobetes bacterium ADurb.Bin490]|nr:MAG: hypothetical protein BWY84_00842 [Candidatus Aerophobetes bacterium ADurb.Bin490]
MLTYNILEPSGDHKGINFLKPFVNCSISCFSVSVVQRFVSWPSGAAAITKLFASGDHAVLCVIAFDGRSITLAKLLTSVLGRPGGAEGSFL